MNIGAWLENRQQAAEAGNVDYGYGAVVWPQEIAKKMSTVIIVTHPGLTAVILFASRLPQNPNELSDEGL